MNHQEQIDILTIEIKEIEELLKAIRIYDDIPPVLLRMIHEKALRLADESLKLGEIKSSYVASSLSADAFSSASSVADTPAVQSLEGVGVKEEPSMEEVSISDPAAVEKPTVTPVADCQVQQEISSVEYQHTLSGTSESQSIETSISESNAETEKAEETADSLVMDDAENSTVQDGLAVEEPSAEKANSRPDIRRLMTLNDRFLYMRELFHGDAACMNQTLDALNRQHSLEDAMTFVQNQFHWDKELPGVKLFTDMLERQYKDTLI